MKRIVLFVASIGNFFTMTILNFNPDSIAAIVTPNPIGADLQEAAIAEFIKLFFSILGGLVSTLVLLWLKNKCPYLFNKLSKFGSKRTQDRV